MYRNGGKALQDVWKGGSSVFTLPSVLVSHKLSLLKAYNVTAVIPPSLP
jgi:hypothetical protein